MRDFNVKNIVLAYPHCVSKCVSFKWITKLMYLHLNMRGQFRCFFFQEKRLICWKQIITRCLLLFFKYVLPKTVDSFIICIVWYQIQLSTATIATNCAATIATNCSTSYPAGHVSWRSALGQAAATPPPPLFRTAVTTQNVIGFLVRE